MAADEVEVVVWGDGMVLATCQHASRQAELDAQMRAVHNDNMVYAAQRASDGLARLIQGGREYTALKAIEGALNTLLADTQGWQHEELARAREALLHVAQGY